MTAAREVSNLNPDPLMDLDHSARYTGYKTGRCISVLLSRRTYALLNAEAVYVGRRPHFRQSTLEKFLASRTGAALAEAV